MSIEQICLVVTLNVLMTIFMVWQKRRCGDRSVNLVLVATILTGFAVMWRAFS